MKLTDLTPKQRARIERVVEQGLLTLTTGCRIPKSSTTVVYISPTTPVMYIRHAAWMLATGETPAGRMRATCRTSGCCTPHHLALSDAATRGVPVATARYTTPLQQYQAYEMSLEPGHRAVDIALKVGIPTHRVRTAIEREHARRAEKVRRREQYLHERAAERV